MQGGQMMDSVDAKTVVVGTPLKKQNLNWLFFFIIA
jgi:hypothetical protein